jgi:dTDP-glucose 4,6-dehydratase
VGSETAISIGDLARLVARRVAERARVEIAAPETPGRAAARYVPSTARIRHEHGVAVTIELEDALTRTVAWHRGRLVPTHVEH